jgi:ribosomal protein S18 acetylase RimI-like enzyme
MLMTYHDTLLDRLTIRHIHRDDLPHLEWEGEFSHFRHLYEHAFEQSLQGRAVLWIGELNKESVIGQLFVNLFSSRRELADGTTRAYIYGFRVRRSFQGIGIGSRMLLVAEQDLVRRGYSWAVLNVARDNRSARKMYEARGYRVVAPEPGHWSYIDHLGRVIKVNEPAWRMEKQLNL